MIIYLAGKFVKSSEYSVIEKLNSLGHIIKNKLTKDIDLVLCGSINEKLSAIKKAKDLKIKIETIDTFFIKNQISYTIDKSISPGYARDSLVDSTFSYVYDSSQVGINIAIEYLTDSIYTETYFPNGEEEDEEGMVEEEREFAFYEPSFVRTSLGKIEHLSYEEIQEGMDGLNSIEKVEDILMEIADVSQLIDVDLEKKEIRLLLSEDEIMKVAKKYKENIEVRIQTYDYASEY